MSNEKEAKLKALKLTLDKLDKAYGKGTVMRMSDSPIQDVEAIPSGSLGLDIALGVGGYPRGRVIEIYGPESSGKTTLTLHAIAEAQKQIDAQGMKILGMVTFKNVEKPSSMVMLMQMALPGAPEGSDEQAMVTLTHLDM